MLAAGQGHRTTLAQVVADRIGLEPESIRVVQGDTEATPYSFGPFASRTAVVAGVACHRAASALADKLKRIAAHLLEAAADDIELSGQRVSVRGSRNTGLAIHDLARLAHHRKIELPEGEPASLEAQASYDPPEGTFSNATHGVIVEIDTTTGAVRFERYVVVEDCGVVINPSIVEGQVRGGVAQGIGAATCERLVYDETGQCLTATLMDYLVPSAMEIPSVEVHHLETPTDSETGSKGVGESGMIGAPAAIISAVNDAIGHLGVEVNEIPIAPDRVYSCLAATVPSASTS